MPFNDIKDVQTTIIADMTKAQALEVIAEFSSKLPQGIPKPELILDPRHLEYNADVVHTFQDKRYIPFKDKVTTPALLKDVASLVRQGDSETLKEYLTALKIVSKYIAKVLPSIDAWNTAKETIESNLETAQRVIREAIAAETLMAQKANAISQAQLSVDAMKLLVKTAESDAAKEQAGYMLKAAEDKLQEVLAMTDINTAFVAGY